MNRNGKSKASLELLRILHARVHVAARSYIVGRGGVTTLEYGLIAVAVIGIVAIGVATLGGAFDGLFDAVSTDLGGAAQKVEDALPT